MRCGSKKQQNTVAVDIALEFELLNDIRRRKC
jgi:hypothetical protein